MRIAGRITGTAGAKEGYRRYPREARRAVARVNAEFAGKVAREAQRRAPVRTGGLRRTIRKVLDERALKAFVTAGHGLPDIRAIVQELGSIYQDAQPYLVPAAEKYAGAYQSAIARALGRIR